jgi:hypothetical protein
MKATGIWIVVGVLSLGSVGCTMCAAPYDDCCPVSYSQGHTGCYDGFCSIGGGVVPANSSCPTCQASMPMQGTPKKNWLSRLPNPLNYL